jgi:hypothetical protein
MFSKLNKNAASPVYRQLLHHVSSAVIPHTVVFVEVRSFFRTMPKRKQGGIPPAILGSLLAPHNDETITNK